MALASNRLVSAVWHVFPAPVRRKLRGNTGRRLIRFAPSAVLAFAATQVTYDILMGPAEQTAGISGAAGWLAGAAVSYVVSRWAWERKGRPNLLKETLPFWAISICVGIVLTLASKLGAGVARSAGFTEGAGYVLIAQGFYLVANAVTFVLRFLIFHYVLFAGPRSAGEPSISSSSETAVAPDGAEPFALVPERGTAAGDDGVPDRR
jgi:putative flippase GtrA